MIVVHGETLWSPAPQPMDDDDDDDESVVNNSFWPDPQRLLYNQDQIATNAGTALPRD